jgi:hypothetical protein
LFQGKREVYTEEGGKKKKGKKEDPEINKIDVLVLLEKPPPALSAKAAEAYYWSNTASFVEVKRDGTTDWKDELVDQVRRYVVS